MVGMELVKTLQREDLTLFRIFNFHRCDHKYFVSAVSKDEAASLLPRLNRIQAICRMWPKQNIFL